MKTLFTAEAISKGGRSGTLQTPDGLLNVTLGNPLEKGIKKRGPNPELLFGGAYSACYHGALINAAKKLGTPVKDSAVRALVSLIEDDQGGYRLAVELHAQLPGIDRAQAQRIMNKAHKTCPYSKSPARRHLRQADGGLAGGASTRRGNTFCCHVGGESRQTTKTKLTIMTTLEIKGDWNITKGKLKQKWAKLTDDDLQYAEGKQEELVGRIQKRTGETREAIEKAIKESCSTCCCN